MPNRILREGICTNEQINALSPFEETFFYRLIVNADDYGRMDGRTAILRSRLYPLKSVRDEQIENALASLTSAELVLRYNVHGKPFVRLTGWERNQQIRARKSRYPAPEESDDPADAVRCNPSISSDTHCNQMISNDIHCNQMISDDCNCSRNPIQSESKSESKSRENTRAKRFSPPTVEDVHAYCSEHSYAVDAQRFVDYYTANGWMVGKNRMKDWRATVRTWASRDRQPAPSKPNPALNYEQRTHQESDYSGLFVDLEAEYAKEDRK